MIDGTADITQETAAQDAQAAAGGPGTGESTQGTAPAELGDLTVKSLRVLCVDRGVDFDSKTRKADLVALLTDHKKAMTPRFGQGICKYKGCKAPLRIRQKFKPIETDPGSGVFLVVRKVECKGPRHHSYKITEKVDGSGSPIG